MTSSESNAQKLPLWIFFVSDAALLAAAAYLATHAPRPLTTQAIFTVTALVLAGTIAALVPLVARYERQKNEALDDRQRALEALARTLTASAEQISIATAGLNDIADLAQKNLKQAEQLPAKFQEKVAELTSRLAASEADTLEVLEKELASLRSGESARLAATADKIVKAAADLAQLETSTLHHLAAARESLAQLGSTSAQHFAELDTATTAAIAQAHTASAAALDAAHLRVTASLDEKLAVSLAMIDEKLAALTSRLAAQVDSAASTLDLKLAALTAASTNLTVPPVVPTQPEAIEAPETPRRARKARREEIPTEILPEESPAPAATPAPAPLEEIAPVAPTLAAIESAPVTPAAEIPAAPSPELGSAPSADPATLSHEILGVAPVTSAPFFHGSPFEANAPEATVEASLPAESPTLVADPVPAVAPTPTEEPKPVRKRSPKKSAEPPAEPIASPAPEPSPEPFVPAPEPVVTEPAPAPDPTPAPAEPLAAALVEPAAAEVESAPAPVVEPLAEEPVEDAPPPAADEFVQFSPDELPPAPAAAPEFKLHSPDATVSSMTADGATRLLATAYIGIGNRLFIRGDGPGLTWEKGVPLQFVSIGKWRWETAEAAAPIAFKLYKNDTVECTALGEQAITPGHLTEVTAAF